MYSIDFDKAENLIAITLGGFFSVDEIGSYIADLRDGFRANRMRAGYLMSIDTNACAIQPQEVLTALASHMASFPKARRIAMISASSLARMQVRRLMTQPYMRIFATADEGRAWLLSDAPGDAPSALPIRATA